MQPGSHLKKKTSNNDVNSVCWVNRGSAGGGTCTNQHIHTDICLIVSARVKSLKRTHTHPQCETDTPAIMLWKAVVRVLLLCHNAVCIPAHTAKQKHYLGDKALFPYLSPSTLHCLTPQSSLSMPCQSLITSPLSFLTCLNPPSLSLRVSLSLCPLWMSFCQPVVILPAASLSHPLSPISTLLKD